MQVLGREKLQERRKMDGVGLADSVETFGVDVRSERLRSNVEGYGEEKVVRCEVLHGLEELWCSDWRWFDISSFLQEEPAWLRAVSPWRVVIFPLPLAETVFGSFF